MDTTAVSHTSRQSSQLVLAKRVLSSFHIYVIFNAGTRLRAGRALCCPIRFICSYWAACHACLQHGHRRCRLALPCCSAMLLRLAA